MNFEIQIKNLPISSEDTEAFRAAMSAAIERFGTAKAHIYDVIDCIEDAEGKREEVRGEAQEVSHAYEVELRDWGVSPKTIKTVDKVYHAAVDNLYASYNLD